MLVHSCIFRTQAPGTAYRPPRFPDKDYDLTNSFEFDECLERDPLQIAEKLLTLLEDNPKAFKQLLCTNLKRANGAERVQVIGFIDGLLLRMLATPELIKHIDRVVMGEYSNKAFAAISSRDFDPRGKCPEVAAAYRLQQEYKIREQERAGIWKLCETVIHSLFGDGLDELRLNDRLEYQGDGKIVMTLGHFLERVNHKIGWTALKSRTSRFNPVIDALQQVLAYLQDQTDINQHPRIHRVMVKASKLLQNSKVRNELFTLILKIDDEIGSPKKRRPSTERRDSSPPRNKWS